LEEADYSTILQAWDFDAGAHFVTEMHRATQITERTIAVLSTNYVESSYAAPEWQEAYRSDPQGAARKLLVFRVEDCPRPRLLGQLVSVDLSVRTSSQHGPSFSRPSAGGVASLPCRRVSQGKNPQLKRRPSLVG
jgi:hypothetical protein